MTNTGDRASVVVGISTCNRADMLRKAIQSALGQSHRPLRVSVTDDASSDHTPAIRNEFPEISWTRSDQRQGYLRARNRIMLSADERYYVSLDDDAWFLDGDEIALAVDLLGRHPMAAAVAFDIISPDRPQRKARGSKESVSSFIGCGHVLRLSVVKDLRGYFEFPGAYGSEEKDLCVRLIDAGYEIVKLNGVHVWHEKTTSARDHARQHASGVCNDLTFTVRRAPLMLLVPAISYKFAAHFLFSLRRGLIRSFAVGIRHFVVVAKAAWHSRAPVRMASFTKYYKLVRAPRKIIG